LVKLASPTPALGLLAAMHHQFARLVPTARPALPPIHGGAVCRSSPPDYRAVALRRAPGASAAGPRACRPLAVSAQSISPQAGLRSLRISLLSSILLGFFFFVLVGSSESLRYDLVGLFTGIYLVHGIEASVVAVTLLLLTLLGSITRGEFCSYSGRGSTNFADLVVHKFISVM